VFITKPFSDFSPSQLVVPVAGWMLRSAVRQELPPAFHREGSLYISRRDVVMTQNSLFGARVIGYEMDPARSVNIDTPDDWQMAERLIEVGIGAIDVAGAGGTSWARVESERASDARQRRLGQTFANWGIPTADCILNARRVAPHLPLIASGGLRNGLDVAKTLALGADLAGLAFPFLRAAHDSEAAVAALADVLIAELRTVLFCTGQGNLAELKQGKSLERADP
ncbi:MAG: hypothetical protein HC929_25285, partial [Leptolyngbyaceae cyanobacterium SM2_5_2]|nr:hypothetical protein [Leptolyngbyaceae cyanobacterium SM2_5_2]